MIVFGLKHPDSDSFKLILLKIKQIWTKRWKLFLTTKVSEQAYEF